MDCLGIGAVLGQGYVIKKRLRRLSESSYFLSPLYLLLSGGKVISEITKLKDDRSFRVLSGLSGGIPGVGALLKFFHNVGEGVVCRFPSCAVDLTSSILKIIRRLGLRLGPVVYVFMDESEIEVYGKQFEGAGMNYNGSRVLRLHAVFLEDFLCGIQLHEAKHFVTYGWEYLLKRLTAAGRALRARSASPAVYEA